MGRRKVSRNAQEETAEESHFNQTPCYANNESVLVQPPQNKNNTNNNNNNQGQGNITKTSPEVC